MTPVAILALLEAAEPAVQSLVVTLVKAFHAKDEKAVREATEAALRLAFEARQAVPK
jgi:hypothetical protein